ncbi:hypothetical protein DFA_03835 [Cavenderia fasciculata]|uniref:Nucleotide exchange factor Fes1 domain-containing protein n=1 Tax=Cavenderia fasciculata TaxID=261658 RepID=F4Q0J0_CACFS|nr:uncharacterized protein DFA_03835 [Cavenderia fasciculata]EGG18341.1 hypothetical protein DFA_03835 [Cavenderia fasciculata]|eukprot:XP_004366245.1 hypothetical protein DFA_03835 [Cavenderia fasciculata]
MYLGAPIKSQQKGETNKPNPKPASSYNLPRDIGPGLLKFCLTHSDSPNLQDSQVPERDPKDYDWLRQAFENLEDDAKRMKKINDVLADPQSTQHQIITALEQLEFYIEDIDNSKDYIKIGGIPIIVELMKNEDDRIRAEATSCVAILSQNEESIQAYLNSIGVLDLAINILGREHDQKCREKFLSLISSLIGNVDTLDQQKADTVLKICISYLAPSVDIMIPKPITGELTTYSVANSVSGMTKAVHILRKILQGKPSLRLKGVEWGIVEALVNLIKSYNNGNDQKDAHLTILCEKCESTLLELSGNPHNKKQCIDLGLPAEIDKRLKKLMTHPNENENEIEVLKNLKSKIK